jgi:nucleolar protein 12
MSLLGSIFGRAAADDTATSTNKCLFDKSEALPGRPQHKSVTRKIKETRQEQSQEGDVVTRRNSFGIKKEDDRQDAHPRTPTAKKKRKSRHSRNDAEDDDDTHSAKKKRKDKPDTSYENDTEDVDVVDDDVEGNSDKKTETDEDGERTIFVGNLPLATTTRKSLAALFKDCGPVASTRIRSVPVTGVKLPQDRAGDQRLMKKVCVNTNQIDDSTKNTMHGYVVFKSVDSVSKALALNNTIVVEGLRLRIDRATPTVDASRSVFVGNLPYLAEESTLLDHFVKGCIMEAGDVQGVRIVCDKDTYQCKGFGYVLFRDKTMVPTALKMDGSTYMKKQLRVMVCGKRFKGKRGDRAAPTKPKYAPSTESSEKVTVGAFRRIIAKQQQDNTPTNQRKRGEKKKAHAVKAAAGGLSKRASLDKKVDKRVKKLEQRISKGMGKTRKTRRS